MTLSVPADWGSLAVPLLLLFYLEWKDMNGFPYPARVLVRALAAQGITLVLMLVLTGWQAAFSLAVSSLAGALAWTPRLRLLHRLDLFSLFCPPALLALISHSDLLLAFGLVILWAVFIFITLARFRRRFGIASGVNFLILGAFGWIAGNHALLCLVTVMAGVLLIAGCLMVRPRKPLVLFDLDGTLIDSQLLVFETFRRVFARKKPEYTLSSEELYSFFGPTLETTFARYFAPEEIDDVIELYQQINLDLHQEYLSRMPGALDLVRTLSQQGYSLGIVSNKRRKPVLLGLELSGLAPYFPLVLGKEDLPAPKPAPQGLMEAARQAGYHDDETVYVGDNASDIQAARKAGMFSVGYTLDKTQKQSLGAEEPGVLIDALNELSGILMEDRLWIDKSIW